MSAADSGQQGDAPGGSSSISTSTPAQQVDSKPIGLGQSLGDAAAAAAPKPGGMKMKFKPKVPVRRIVKESVSKVLHDM